MILAADLGSTSFKAAVFAPDGRRLGEAELGDIVERGGRPALAALGQWWMRSRYRGRRRGRRRQWR